GARCRPGTPASTSIPRRAAERDETNQAGGRAHLPAWGRTGFAAFAVSLGAGKIVPSLAKGPRWPYTNLGAGFALLGVALVGYGLMRQRQVEAAIPEGTLRRPTRWSSQCSRRPAWCC